MRKSTEEQARRFGRQCSGFFESFLQWIIENAKEDGVQEVFFLTREGEFFKSILDKIKLEEKLKLDYKLLQVSRMSTFLPSMKKFDKDDWDRFLNQYKGQTIVAFARSMGTPFSETMEMLQRYGLREHISIEEQLERFYEVVTSDEVVQYFHCKSIEALSGMMKYLGQCGIDDSPGKIAVVDIGWRGTIQDNLCRVLPGKVVYGYYLGMIPTLNIQPKNGVKKGFINKLNFSNALLKSHTQLEMVCSSQHGSIVSYGEVEPGFVNPVEDDNTNDILSWNQYAKYFQEGVLEGIREKTVRNSFKRKKYFELSKTISLLRMTLYPNRGLAEAFFKFCYSEKFGLGIDVDQSKLGFSFLPFLNAIKGSEERKELRKYLNKTMWPQGFMRIHGLSVIIPFYNVILLMMAN